MDLPACPARFVLRLAAALGGRLGQNVSGQPNVTLTSQDNPQVNVLQLGADGPSATLKDQHITGCRPTDTGPGTGMTINPGSATGVDKPGGALRLSDGISTGAAAGGGIAFLCSARSASGSQQNIQQDRLYITDVGGYTVLYPASGHQALLGLSNAPFTYAYIENLLCAGPAAFWGHPFPPAQPAAPVTLADVIAIIRGCGLSA